MSWRHKVNVKESSGRPPLWHPEPGESIIEIVDEPDEPVSMKYGLRLPLTIRLAGSGDTFTWLIPWRDEVGPDSLLGQLKKIADGHNGLKGLKLRILVSVKGGRRSYKLMELEG